MVLAAQWGAFEGLPLNLRVYRLALPLLPSNVCK